MTVQSLLTKCEASAPSCAERKTTPNQVQHTPGVQQDTPSLLAYMSILSNTLQVPLAQAAVQAWLFAGTCLHAEPLLAHACTQTSADACLHGRTAPMGRVP